MAEKIYSRPVIPLLISMMAGITAGLHYPGHGRWVWIAISVGTGYLLFLIKQNKTALISPLILFFAAGYLSLQPWVVPRLPSNHIIHFTDTHRWEIVGVVISNPIESNNRQKFILETESLAENRRSFPVTGKIRVTVMGGVSQLSAGDRVSFSSRIRSIRNFNNPGGFDYQRYMTFKRIWGTVYVRGEKLKILGHNPGKGISRFIQGARDAICELIEITSEGDQKGILKALIVGDRNQIEPSLREAFNRAGVGHLLAISGLHIGIVATGAFIFFSWLLSRFKFFLWKAWTKKGAALLSLFPVFIYGILAGMSPSTQRAVIMVTVFLVTFITEREHDLINTLALAAMLILVVHPPSLFSISFQLSFVAVLSIIYGLSQTYKPLKKDKRRFKLFQKLFSFLLVSFFANLGTMPLVMFYFNQVSLVGLLANLLLVPLIGFIVVPLGLVSTFIYPLSSSGALICIKASAAVLGPAIDIIRFLAEMPLAAVKTVTPTYFEIGCFYLLAWAILNIIKFEPRASENWSRFPRRKIAVIVAVAVIIAGWADAFYWLHKRFWHDDLRVTIIDVGQGSSALLEMPGGPIFLIDGGGFSDNTVFDVGARVIAPFLWRKKIKTVDTLILSHPNCDHLNGLIYIARYFRVKRVLTNNEAASTVAYQRFVKIVEQNNIDKPRFRDVRRMQNIKGVQLQILYPPRDFLDKRKKEKWRNPNNDSIVVKVKFGLKSILFPGDIQAPAERELVSMEGARLKSTILVAPHHGSRSSSTAEFLNKVKPELVIISSGWKNSYKFPHPSVLKRYRRRGCRILRTDCNGAVTIFTDGQSLRIKPTITD